MIGGEREAQSPRTEVLFLPALVLKTNSWAKTSLVINKYYTFNVKHFLKKENYFR